MYLKPKDMALKLHLPAHKVSSLAKDLENAGCCSFRKTPLGSFLFVEKDILVLQSYADTLYFFKRKKHAIDMVKEQMGPRPEEKEDVLKHMKNAHFV